jgi:hypothetical protein
LLYGNEENRGGGVFQSLHSTFSQLLFVMDETLLPNVLFDGNLQSLIPFSGLFSALGTDRFALLLCELLVGAPVHVVFEADNEVLGRRVFNSLVFLAPSNNLTLSEQSKDESLQVAIVSGGS